MKFSLYCFLKRNSTENYFKPNKMNQGRNQTENSPEMLLTWIVPKSCMLVIHEHVQFTFMSAIDSSFCCSFGFFFWKSSMRFFILLPISAKFRYIFCEKGSWKQFYQWVWLSDHLIKEVVKKNPEGRIEGQENSIVMTKSGHWPGHWWWIPLLFSQRATEGKEVNKLGSNFESTKLNMWCLWRKKKLLKGQNPRLLPSLEMQFIYRMPLSSFHMKSRTCSHSNKSISTGLLT